MALAKDHTINNSAMCLNHVYPYYESDHFGGSSIQGSDQSSPGLYGVEEQPNKVFEEGRDSSTKNFTISSSSSLSSPSSTNSSGLGYQTMKYQSDDGNSVINFKSGYGNSTHSIGSLLSFEKNEQFHQSGYGNREDFSIWENNVHHSYQNQLLLENSSRKSNMPTATTSGGTDFGREEAYINKRPYMEESSQHYKKQCTAAEKQLKPKSSPSKDPQSIAAKNRRERISERLKILQELVPNGSKVDLVTMLEKAIGYVKFLQLQVKVLAADEFWPAQGGRAPDLSQVKEAIDAIIASQRNRNSSSK